MKINIAKYRNLLYGPIAFAVLLIAITVMLACQRQNEGAANTPQAETTPTAQPSAAEQPSNLEASLAEQLNWSQITQNMGGPTFPQHFKASVTGGSVFLSVINTANGNGGDLAFVR